MKRFLQFSILFFWIFTLFGCQSKSTPLCRVVTAVEISCKQKDLHIQRNYTDSKKMQAVLLYLRLLNPRGTPKISPDVLDKDIYQITVHLSDGQSHIYKQTAHRYFQNYQGVWMFISPENATRLYELMAKIPSDNI